MMRATVLGYIVAPIVMMVLCACSQERQPPVTNGDAPAAGTDVQKTPARPVRLTADAAVALAKVAAEKSGFHLNDFSVPQAKFESAEPDQRSTDHGVWMVVFEAKQPLPGNHFLVWVDDRDGTTRVVRGE